MRDTLRRTPGQPETDPHTAPPATKHRATLGASSANLAPTLTSTLTPQPDASINNPGLPPRYMGMLKYRDVAKAAPPVPTQTLSPQLPPPPLKKNRYMGMLKYRDVVKAAQSAKGDQRVKVWMRRNTVTVPPDAPLDELEASHSHEWVYLDTRWGVYAPHRNAPSDHPTAIHTFAAEVPPDSALDELEARMNTAIGTLSCMCTPFSPSLWWVHEIALHHAVSPTHVHTVACVACRPASCRLASWR